MSELTVSLFEVQIVRSKNEEDILGGGFTSVYDKLLINLNLTPAESLQYNGVAEGGLGIIMAAAMVARIWAKTIFSHVQLLRPRNHEPRRCTGHPHGVHRHPEQQIAE